MIDEYRFAYEISLVRKSKLHCHPADAIKFAYRYKEKNFTILSSTMAKIEDESATWNRPKKISVYVRTGIVIWLMLNRFPYSSIARIIGASIPSVRWSDEHGRKTLPFSIANLNLGTLEVIGDE